MSMNKIQRLLLPLTVLLGIFVFHLSASAELPAAPFPPTPTPAPEGVEELDRIQTAVENAIAAESENVLSFLVNHEQVENIEISPDGDTAIAWIVLKDPETGEILPIEPGLAFAVKDPDTGWSVILPSAPNWVDQLQGAPAELVSEELKQFWLEMLAEQIESANLGPLGGYLLPWAKGNLAWLSQSVAHDKYTPSGSAHYAFDFYVPQTMFNLYASKPGIVWYARWDVSNNNHVGVGNYLVLQDNSTNPATYQLYLHLAQNSIPPALRARGAPVVQGQFIGIADNTGQSSGHHLHFQVHTNPNSYWGTSVDITFADVAINGGRPRVHNSYYSDLPYCQHNSTYNDVCDQVQSSYISGNTVAGDITPPYGGITKPAKGSSVNSGQVLIEGWAKDDGSGLDKAQIIANFQGSWLELGSSFSSSPFSLNWDMCGSNVPDGPVSLALQIWDKQGNQAFGLPGLVHFTKSYACPPPPTCSPNQDQVALFAGSNFAGSCKILGVGDYPGSASFSSVGDDNLEGIKVGANVLATLFSDGNYSGRGETFAANDSNLADNLIGSNTVSSLRVRLRSSPPDAPAVLISPKAASVFAPTPSLSLSWRIPAGATEFQARINGPGGETISDWLSAPFWHLDSAILSAGAYSWQVRARNSSQTSAWSATSTFTVSSGGLPSSSVTAPLSEAFESGASSWTASGLWNLINDTNRSHAGSVHSWYYGEADGDYKNDSPNLGDLTSPEILLPAENQDYTLRFWYRYKTEGSEKHWDQRWVQISENGGAFKNVLQLVDDPESFWLGPRIDLSPYAGSSIRVRFHFETLDGAFNNFEGWYIDDFEIATAPIEACSDTNNAPGQATLIGYGQTINELICPGGDIDYFKFSASAGDRVVVDIDTPVDNQPDDADLYLFLLDSDGNSVLAENDDEVFAVRRDPHLGYLFNRAGTYYLKVRSWAHPSAGGSAYPYVLRLAKDNTPPAASFTYPVNGSYLPDGKFTLQVDASDASGISHVDFIWHSGNWLYEKWSALGSDWDGSDGWTYTFDTKALAEQNDIAFYTHVYDWAGNWRGAGTWELKLDRTPPAIILFMPLVKK